MLEINIPVEKRLEAASRYYSLSSEVESQSWIDVFLQIESDSTFGIPELLVLLDPKFYSELDAKDPRGERAFKTAKDIRKCRSQDLWGYACPFTDVEVHIDHTFPRAKGGVTHPQNAMYLCGEHNRAKSTDIHMIPWEGFTKANLWIQQSLKHLISSAARTTNENLYFPEKQLLRGI